MTDTISTPPLRDLPTGHLDVRKQHLLNEIAREPTGPRHTPHLRLPLPTHRRRWRIAAIAVAAAAAAAITVPLLVLNGNGGPGSAKSYIHPLPRISTSERGGRQLASLVLLRAARTAAKQPATGGLAPGQFFYTKSEGWQEAQEGRPTGRLPTYFQPFTREMWISSNGSGRTHEVDEHVLFPTAADAAYFTHALRNQQQILNAHTSDSTFKPGDFPYINLGNAPADLAQFKKLVENLSAFPSPAETFRNISDLLRYTYAPPAVRSALYTIASQLPGVQLIGPTHDRLGRPGVGVAYYLPGPPHGPVDKNAIYEMIYDPQTSALLADQTVVVHRTNSTPFPPGTVTSWTAYLASGIVNSTTATTSASGHTTSSQSSTGSGQIPAADASNNQPLALAPAKFLTAESVNTYGKNDHGALIGYNRYGTPFLGVAIQNISRYAVQVDDWTSHGPQVPLSPVLMMWSTRKLVAQGRFVQDAEGRRVWKRQRLVPFHAFNLAPGQIFMILWLGIWHDCNASRNPKLPRDWKTRNLYRRIPIIYTYRGKATIVTMHLPRDLMGSPPGYNPRAGCDRVPAARATPGVPQDLNPFSLR
jgi:hypothetical protein